MKRLLDTGKQKCATPKRYYLTRRWRFIAYGVFSILTCILWLRGKLTFLELRIVLRRLPWLLLKDGSMSALGFIVNAIGYGTFARSEIQRIKRDKASAS
ncbi:MAG: hypothetical protein JXR76_23895 [Deltaproteobacteria bacterium]|nr:hypothetical protein [Deltaproteobacteria bacterium]